MPLSTNTTFGPLDNVTVIDLTQVVAGGTCTSHFADFGSNVIKVEHPSTGDIIRNWGPFSTGQALWWAVIGRKKISYYRPIDARRERTLAEVSKKS